MNREDLRPSALRALEWAERHGMWEPLAHDIRKARWWREQRGKGGQQAGVPAGACWPPEHVDYLAEQCRAHGVDPDAPEDAVKLTPEQLHVLQHAMGADKYGRPPRGHTEYYRNRYVGESTECEALCAAGLMARREVHPILTGGDPLYVVTDDGKRAMLEASPKPPKLTRSQERYRRFLAADCGLTFREWLVAERTVAP